MQQHRMPPDTRDKERIFGGVLTIIQAVFIASGFIIGLILFGILQSIIKFLPISIIGLLAGAGVGVFFALYKKHGVMYHTFLIRQKKFNKKTKFLVNRNEKSSLSSIKRASAMTEEEKERLLEENNAKGGKS